MSGWWLLCVVVLVLAALWQCGELARRFMVRHMYRHKALGIPSIAYLVTTRLLASATAVLPLYVMCLALSYFSCQVIVRLSGAGSMGAYLHYFTLMLSGTDIVYSVLKAVVFVWIASTIQCYYGFFASGGPEGVGVAAGHAMRAAITVVTVANMLLTLALWGVDTGARFGG